MRQIRKFFPLLLLFFILFTQMPAGNAASLNPSPSLLPAEPEDVEELLSRMPEDWPEAPAINSHSAIVLDADSGAILYAKNATERCEPASLVKILTALIAIENGNLTDMVTFSSSAINSLPAGSTHIAMLTGEEMTLSDCLYGLLLPSANEVANAIAEHIAGSVPDFVLTMNERAEEIGVVNSSFTNPTGLNEEGLYSCAYDLALIMAECVANPTFCAIDSASSYLLPATNKHSEERVIATTDNMMRSGSEYYDARVIGGKTGRTDSGGQNLITYATDGEKHVIVVTMDAKSPHEYSDTEALLDYAFSSFSTISASVSDLTEESPLSGENPLSLPRTSLDRYVLAETSYVTLPSPLSREDLTVSLIEGDTETPILLYTDQDYPIGYATLTDQALADSGFVEGSLIPDDMISVTHSSLLPVIAGVGLVILLLVILFAVHRYKKKHAGFSFR